MDTSIKRPRNRADLWTPAERAICDAAQAVESMPASIHLTESVTLLSQARDKVADFIDSKEGKDWLISQATPV